MRIWCEEMRGREEKILEKKLTRWAHNSVQHNYQSATKLSVCCLKTGQSMFQNHHFKHRLLNNLFQTTREQEWSTKHIFYFLDTSVQCLNTKHYVLKWVTKRPPSLSPHSSLIFHSYLTTQVQGYVCLKVK